MTEEGELKKRINYVFMKPRYTPNEMVPELKELWQDIHNVADEAKKDIESKALFHVYSYHQDDTGTPSIIIPLSEWKKWFGGCEESSGEATQI